MWPNSRSRSNRVLISKEEIADEGSAGRGELRGLGRLHKQQNQDNRSKHSKRGFLSIPNVQKHNDAKISFTQLYSDDPANPANDEGALDLNLEEMFEM